MTGVAEARRFGIGVGEENTPSSPGGPVAVLRAKTQSMAHLDAPRDTWDACENAAPIDDLDIDGEVRRRRRGAALTTFARRSRWFRDSCDPAVPRRGLAVACSETHAGLSLTRAGSYRCAVAVMRARTARGLRGLQERLRESCASDQGVCVEVMGLEPTTSTLRRQISRILANLHDA